MAQALLRATTLWLGGAASQRAPSALSPPSVVVAIKALACELPHEHGRPLSRLSVPDIKGEVLRRGLVASIGETTLWRWLTDDALRPWRHRSWVFPRDPQFHEKAGRVLDLYAGLWQGQHLSAQDCVLSTDEKTSLQARRRRHAPLPPGPRQPMRVEHQYARQGGGVGRAASEGPWALRTQRRDCPL